MSRRAALGSAAALGGAGVAGVAAQRMGVLDDGLRTIGVRPHAEPDPRDVRLLAEAASDQRSLIADADALIRQHAIDDLNPLRSVLMEQRAAVSDQSETSGSVTVSDDREAALAAFRAQVETTARARAAAALSAGSLAVTQVLAGMAAGLGQVSQSVRVLT